MKGVTQYAGLARLYSHHLLKRIIEVGELKTSAAKILDFGCGTGELKRLLGEGKVIGFDIIPALSDIPDWRTEEFDVLVANQVFYSFSEKDLEALLVELRGKNPSLRLVVGISRQGVLNNIGKYLLRRPDAHSRTRIGPKKEIEILKKFCIFVKRRGVFSLSDVYVLTFKPQLE